MSIRIATEQDVPPLVELFRGFHREAGLTETYDAVRASMAIFERIYDSRMSRVFILNDFDGALIGQIGYSFLGFSLAEERAWYVRPDARGRGSLELIRAFEQWATDRGVDYVQLARLAGMDSRVGDLFKAKGYSLVEEHYLKRFRQ